MDIKEYLKSTDIVEIRRSMLDTLKEAISDPERMKRFARFVLSTHDYSFFNKFLMQFQCPEVSQVMGYKTWEKVHNRTPKKGSKAIYILAPSMKTITKKDATTKEEKKDKICIGFYPVPVFDISQTEGDDIVLNTELGIKTDNPEDLLRELVFATALDGYSIDLQSMGFKEGSKVEGMNIHINNSLDLESKIVELVNVLSSINLEHYTKRKDVDDVTRNLEVKMVSAIVCSILGTTVNAAINIDDLRDKSITAIFKAADLVAKSIGVKLKQEEVC